MSQSSKLTATGAQNNKGGEDPVHRDEYIGEGKESCARNKFYQLVYERSPHVEGDIEQWAGIVRFVNTYHRVQLHQLGVVPLLLSFSQQQSCFAQRLNVCEGVWSQVRSHFREPADTLVCNPAIKQL